MQDGGRLCGVRSGQSEVRAYETGFFKGLREKAEIPQNAENWRR